MPLKHHTFELTYFGIITHFSDGHKSSNWIPCDPHGVPNSSFVHLSNSLGFQDPLTYLRHHDISHGFLTEKLFNNPSPVLLHAASGMSDHFKTENQYEEKLVYFWQKFVTYQEPLVEDIWQTWRDEYLSLTRSLGLQDPFSKGR